MMYLDNASTSWPKPDVVRDAVARAMEESGGNPGRSGHSLSMNAAREIQTAREAVAAVFGISDSCRIAFTLNTTWAINIALKGILSPGDHVICGSMEHNAVVRPLYALEQRGVQVTKVPSNPSTGLDPDAVRSAFRPNTVAVITCHASNVAGAISPIADIGTLCRGHGIAVDRSAGRTAGPFRKRHAQHP